MGTANKSKRCPECSVDSGQHAIRRGGYAMIVKAKNHEEALATVIGKLDAESKLDRSTETLLNEWLIEDIGQEAPFPNGSLLWWRCLS